MSGRPEANFLSPTVTVPNSALPMLVYWPVLPVPHDQESAKQAFGQEKKKTVGFKTESWPIFRLTITIP